ncbi:MAG TPA: hypothetical protein VFY23_11125 [Candidatus Limnocylindrales bacterium]|nr:hypothetical protein [Candidatus Limnocylindrales bacterium]
MMIHDRDGFRFRVHHHRPHGPVAAAAAVPAPAARAALAGEPGLAPFVTFEQGEPVASRAAPVPASAFVARGDARMLRRLRRVVRRRVRVGLENLVAATATDGEITIRLTTVSPREPRVLAWSADRLVALVVLHDGCGARVIGGGGLMGRLELPSVTCAGASLAFCYDAVAAATLS